MVLMMSLLLPYYFWLPLWILLLVDVGEMGGDVAAAVVSLWLLLMLGIKNDKKG